MGELDDDMLAETDMKGVSGEWHDANPESEATAIPLAGENDAEVEDGEIEDGEVELGKELAAAKAALGRQGKSPLSDSHLVGEIVLGADIWKYSARRCCRRTTHVTAHCRW